MERQLRLDLRDREERCLEFDRYAQPLGLRERERKVLRLLFLDATPELRGGQHLAHLAIARDEAARRARMSKNTWARGVENLVARGLMVVIAIETPWCYVVNWSKFSKLEPTKKLSPLDADSVGQLFGHPPVTPRSGSGHTPVPCTTRESNPRVTRVPCAVNTRVGPGEARAAEQELARGARPWATVTDDELTAAVEADSGKLLRRLYDELLTMSAAGAANWPAGLVDCEDNRLRFLSLCHHAVRIKRAGHVKTAMGVLLRACQRGLDVDYVRQESDRWAERMLRDSRRDPALIDGPAQRDYG